MKSFDPKVLVQSFERQPDNRISLASLRIYNVDSTSRFTIAALTSVKGHFGALRRPATSVKSLRWKRSATKQCRLTSGKSVTKFEWQICRLIFMLQTNFLIRKAHFFWSALIGETKGTHISFVRKRVSESHRVRFLRHGEWHLGKRRVVHSELGTIFKIGTWSAQSLETLYGSSFWNYVIRKTSDSPKRLRKKDAFLFFKIEFLEAYLIEKHIRFFCAFLEKT